MSLSYGKPSPSPVQKATKPIKGGAAVFRVIIFSSAPPQSVARLASRIHREVPEAGICGILYERRAPEGLLKRTIDLLRDFREWAFVSYAIARAFRLLMKALADMGTLVLRLIHSTPARPNGPTHFGLDELTHFCNTIGCPLLVTTEIHSPEGIGFVRRQQPDLGIVYGAGTIRPELFNIPQEGSINTHKGMQLDCHGAGPVGMWELLNGQREIGISVRRVKEKLDAGTVIHARTIPIEPFDTLTSLALKAALVGNDLVVLSVADFARGRVREKPQTENGCMFKVLKAQQLARYQKQIALARTRYKPQRSRPVWKLLLRTLLFGPLVVLRNWFRRLRRSFPVVILYHHLVSDRPHYMGISTESFLRQVKFLQKHYRIASLREAIEMLNNNKVDSPTVVLTFDDGYQDNYINLRAVTEETGIPVTLFICTQAVTNQEEFDHDLKQGHRHFLPLTWEQVRYLSRNGFEIGSHTRSHFDCGSTDPAALQKEIVGSKNDLEHRLGQAVKFFSFPWGKPANMSSMAIELARKTYDYVFSTSGGANFFSRREKLWHLQRCAHPRDSWELELALQSVLEF